MAHWGALNVTGEAEGREPQPTAPGGAVVRPGASNAPPGSQPARARDPLGDCLAFVTRHYGRAYAPEALASGILRPAETFDLASLERAAERIGFVMLSEESGPGRLPATALPVLLPAAEGGPLVLVRREGRRVWLFDPRAGKDGLQRLSVEELDRRGGGQVVFLRPAHRFDRVDAPPERAGHWFRRAFLGNWWIYGHAVLAALFVNLLALAVPLFIMTVYDRVVPNEALETLWVLAAGVALAALFDFLLRSLRAYLVDAAGRRLDVTLGGRLFARVLAMKLGAQKASAGSLAATLREFEFLRDFLGSATLSVLADLPFVLFFLLVIWLIGGELALVPAVALPAVLGAALLVQIPLRHLTRRSLAESRKRQSHLFEVLQGLETLKSVRGEAWAERRWAEVLALSAQTQMRLRGWSQLAANLTQLAQFLVTVGIVVVGVEAIAAGSLTLGALIACVLLANRVLAPVAQISGVLTRLQQARTAFAALDGLMRIPVERPAEEQRVHRPFLSGRIEFREVGFTYPGASVSALENVSFRVEPGERVGIVGRVGSGKSTMLKMAQGFYEPSHGQLRVDDLDLRQLEPADLRRQMGYVAQNTALFRGTIRENLVVGAPEADDAAVMAAAELVGLSEVIRDAPRGLDQEVGEQGLSLSGGQRQLIALARALVLSPPMLLLDEPTSNLDALAERRFLEALAGQLKGRTLLLVTHRAPLLQVVDRLLVIDRGRLLADGPRDEILARLAGSRGEAAQ